LYVIFSKTKLVSDSILNSSLTDSVSSQELVPSLSKGREKGNLSQNSKFLQIYTNRKPFFFLCSALALGTNLYDLGRTVSMARPSPTRDTWHSEPKGTALTVLAISIARLARMRKDNHGELAGKVLGESRRKLQNLVEDVDEIPSVG
jgi:hypothetical protein